MTKMPVYIVDIIGECVKRTNDVIIDQLHAMNTSIDQINYQYGHMLELTETLNQWDKTGQGNLKYPLVWLVTDFTEARGATQDLYATVNLNIVIAHFSNNTDKAFERKTKVFEPVLYPIYYELMFQLSKHRLILVQDENQIPHNKTDRYYWGRVQVGNTLNDYVDAIDIENLNLKILFKNCNPEPTKSKKLNGFAQT